MDQFLLSGLIMLPLLGALIILFLPKEQTSIFRWVAVVFTGCQLFMAFQALLSSDFASESIAGVDQLSNFYYVEKYDWIDLNLGSLGYLSIDYILGVDGLSILMVLLSALVMFVGSFSSFDIKEKERGYYSLYLLLSATVMGCFLALDFFLFFLFFEFMLLPMYFLIGIWGGARREYAAIKFFLYTLLGSIFILLVMIGLSTSVIDPVATAVQAGLAKSEEFVTQANILQIQQELQQILLSEKVQVHTFNLIYMMDAQNYIPGSLLSVFSGGDIWGLNARLWAFLLLFVGFLIKLPGFPVHTWLPDAHVQAPTAISVVLAGLLLKVGGYGLMRIAYSIFPDGAIHFAWWIGLVGVISIIYAAFVALGTHNLKKMIAYSSISHMGFVLLGLASCTSEGVQGAMYQLFSHGIISPMLFLLAGVLYHRTHHLEIGTYKGLSQKMPAYSGWVVVAFFASLGLPGFSGFVAEVMVFIGAFSSATTNALLPRWMPIVATLGLVTGAAYYLWTYQRMFLGQFSVQKAAFIPLLKDLTPREWAMIAPLGIITLVLGLFPNLLLDPMSSSVNYFVEMVLQTGRSYIGK